MPPNRLATRDNALLARLPAADLLRMEAASESINLVFADVICEAGEAIEHVYFPRNSFISLIMPIDPGAALEVGMVGDEGVFGAVIALGVHHSPVRALIQGGGEAWRMTATDFQRELDRSTALQAIVGRYVCVQLAQLAQTAACTRFHLIDARLARWLLMTQDRAHASKFAVTQEFLAMMLGVRRVGVTKAAGELQRRGLIAYVRGALSVLDRRGLKAAACSCYNADRDTYARIMG